MFKVIRSLFLSSFFLNLCKSRGTEAHLGLRIERKMMSDSTKKYNITHVEKKLLNFCRIYMYQTILCKKPMSLM